MKTIRLVDVGDNPSIGTEKVPDGGDNTNIGTEKVPLIS